MGHVEVAGATVVILADLVPGGEREGGREGGRGRRRRRRNRGEQWKDVGHDRDVEVSRHSLVFDLEADSLAHGGELQQRIHTCAILFHTN